MGALDPVPKTPHGTHATAWRLPSSHKGLGVLEGHRSTHDPTQQPTDFSEQPARSLRPRWKGTRAACTIGAPPVHESPPVEATFLP